MDPGLVGRDRDPVPEGRMGPADGDSDPDPQH